MYSDVTWQNCLFWKWIIIMYCFPLIMLIYCDWQLHSICLSTTYNKNLSYVLVILFIRTYNEMMLIVVRYKHSVKCLFWYNFQQGTLVWSHKYRREEYGCYSYMNSKYTHTFWVNSKYTHTFWVFNNQKFIVTL